MANLPLALTGCVVMVFEIQQPMAVVILVCGINPLLDTTTDAPMLLRA